MNDAAFDACRPPPLPPSLPSSCNFIPIECSAVSSAVRKQCRLLSRSRKRTEDAALLKKTSLPLREWGEGGGVKERVDWDGTTTLAEESIFCSIGREPSASQSSSSVGALRGIPHNGSGSVFGFVQGYPQFDVGSGIQLDGS